MFEQDLDAESSAPDATADACGETPIVSPGRFWIFTAALITMIFIGPALFLWLKDQTGGIQFASVVSYTAATILYTFSANRGMQRFLFNCPYVRSQFRRLTLRHVGFIVALLILETAGLEIMPHLSSWWFAESGPRGMTPFYIAMAAVCGTLCLAEVITNRSILERAHDDANTN
jgi:hypothetical protein